MIKYRDAAYINEKLERKFRPPAGTIGILPAVRGTYIFVPKPCIATGPRGGCITSFVNGKPRWSEKAAYWYVPRLGLDAEEIRQIVAEKAKTEPEIAKVLGNNFSGPIMDYSPLKSLSDQGAALPKPFQSDKEKRLAQLKTTVKKLKKNLAHTYDHAVKFLRENNTKSETLGDLYNVRSLAENLATMQDRVLSKIGQIVGHEKGTQYAKRMMRPYFADAAAMTLGDAIQLDGWRRGSYGLIRALDYIVDAGQEIGYGGEHDWSQKTYQLLTRTINEIKEMREELRAGKLVSPKKLTTIAKNIKKLDETIRFTNSDVNREVHEGLAAELEDVLLARLYMQAARGELSLSDVKLIGLEV